ncbi:MAG: toll/interleukin-1 receptor domain-containing protein [Clostridia bacterium]|nr:toll/interleukin-1 receptor domain-containing protein [Clostridia bacterium]
MMTENTSSNNYEIFISYRRNGGDLLAKLLYETLLHKKYSVFFDHESLSAGIFGEKILDTIRRSKDVIVVLSKECLKRCKNKDDWMLLEIREAIETGKNITLVFSEDFKMPSSQELIEYPKEIQTLLTYQGYLINVEHYDNTLKKICDGFESQPVSYTENDAHQAASFLLKNGTSNLSDDEKIGLLDGVVSSYYGTKIASVMSSFLQTNPRYYNNIRLKFNYEISIDSVFPFGNIAIDKKNYFKLSESLSYQKHFLDTPIGQEFWISFVRDLDDVDESLRNENYIFSENLLIDENDMNNIINLSEEDQKTFFTKHMRVRFNLNGRVLEPVVLTINKAGIFAKYVMASEESHNKSTVLDVKIAFTIPHRKIASYFFASISDPTYSPHISFSYPEDEVNVEMISFMNRNITTANAKIFEGLREIFLDEEWVIPMSGVVFIMSPKCYE